MHLPRLRTRTVALLSLLTALALAAGVALVTAGPAQPQRQGPTRLNVVLILTDDERSDDNRTMRSVARLLAAHGVTFAEAHVTTSECCPSRASILSGQYSHHHKVVGNFGKTGYLQFDESNTLATWLSRAGYSTALVGKYLNDYSVYGHHRIPPGWGRWVVMDTIPEEKYYRYTLNVNGSLRWHGRRPADYSTTVLSDYANGFIARAREPFFLYFAPIAPHDPATPAPPDIAALPSLPPPRTPSFNEADIRDKPWRAYHATRLSAGGIAFVADLRRRRLETLRAVDRSVTRLVRTLRDRGVLDRTVILYMSDNGFLLGEHRLGGKIWPYEESTHVPLVVRTPWATGASVDRHPVLNIDLASTIAGLGGVRPGRPQDGQSLVPFLRGKTTPWRSDFVVEYRGLSQLRVGGPPRFKALRNGRYLYVAYDNGWRELYDHRVDPFELRNVVAEPGYAGVVRRLSARLRVLYAQPPRPS